MNNQFGTRCETMALSVLWDSGQDLDMQEIRKRCNEKWNLSWKPQTVSTYLTRMVKKGLLFSYRSGRTFLYHPSITKEEHQRIFMEYVVNLYFDSDIAQARVCLDEIKGRFPVMYLMEEE